MRIYDRFNGILLFEDQHSDLVATVVNAHNNQISLRGAKLPGAKLYNTYLEGVDFTLADLTGADFRDCALDGANFNRALLSNARFEDSYMSRADLRGASLCGANFDRARLIGAKFELADLSGASLVEAHITPGALSLCNLTGVNFGDPPSYGDTSLASTASQKGRYASPVSDVPTGPQTRAPAASHADCAYYGTCVLHLVDPHVPHCGARA